MPIITPAKSHHLSICNEQAHIHTHKHTVILLARMLVATRSTKHSKLMLGLREYVYYNILMIILLFYKTTLSFRHLIKHILPLGCVFHMLKLLLTFLLLIF